MSKTRLLSPFCVLSCNQSSSLFSGLLCRFRYSPVERLFYKFDGIDCCPKLNAKPVNRLIHRCWQVPPPVNSATHCFFDGCHHLIDGDVAVGLRHGLASLFRAAAAETTSLAGSAAALCAHSKTRCQTSAMGRCCRKRGFCDEWQAASIQDQMQMRNLDSKIRPPGFDRFKF